MKYIVNILLLVLMVSHTTKTVVTFVSFKWNQDYIATNFCKNKQNITLKCDGKCYLKKQMKKQQKSKDSPLSSKQGQFFDFFIQQNIKTFIFFSFQEPIKIIEQTSKRFLYNLELYSRFFITKIFRPPSCF